MKLLGKVTDSSVSEYCRGVGEKGDAEPPPISNTLVYPRAKQVIYTPEARGGLLGSLVEVI